MYDELEECIQGRNTIEEQFQYNWMVESITKFKEEYYTNVYKKATEMYKNIENKQ